MDLFYWDKKSNGFELEQQLQTIDNVKEIFIASAYFSKEGLDILRRFIARKRVKKADITVCLSPEFTYENPSYILIQLNKIAKVRIAKDGRLFHPKFYYISGEGKNLLIFGSSNLTSGGFGKNIEFDCICEPSQDEIVQVKKFIHYCMLQTDMLTEARIEYYKDQEAKLIELNKIKSQLAVQLSSFEKRDDPFTEDTYDLTDFYFKFIDYETFFLRNIKSTSAAIVAQRKHVQEKLLRIHSVIEQQVNDLDLHAHWDKSKITSLTFPSFYNNQMVEWMGVRYGKRKEEIDLGYGIKEDYESFIKHACLQFNLEARGFEIVLFFAVRTDAWDRQYLKENMHILADKINCQAQKMKGYGLVWRISDCPSFSFDTDNDLARYLKDYDCDGKFSSLHMTFEPDNPRIKTLNNICNEVIEAFKLFKPLYDIIAWRHKGP